MELTHAVLKFSKVYAFLIVIVHAFALVCVLTCALAWWWQGGLLLVVLLSGWWAWQQPCKRVRAISFDGRWRIVDNDGVIQTLEVGAGTVLTRFFVLLVGKSFDERQFAIPIFRDSLALDAFARVQIILRLGL